MSRREIREIIETWKACNGNYSETAERLGIDRRTVKKWVRQGRRTRGNVGWRGIERQSTTPKHPQRILTPVQERWLLSIRQETDFCSTKLSAMAQEKGVTVSISTIHRLLKRHGKLRPTHKRRRPLFQNGTFMRPANVPALGYIQMDVKHVTPELSGLPYTCFEYAAIDILSRYKVALLQPVLDEAGSIILLRYAVQSCPFPVKYLQTDNGLEFQRRFDEVCDKLGIEHYYIHKNSPRENAVIERSFRTDEDEFYLRLEERPEDINELNKWFQRYLIRYNTWRPHIGINMKRPKEVVDLYNKS